MQDTLPSDEYSVLYPIWGLKPWLAEAQILEQLPAFKNLRFKDLLKLQKEYFFKQNLSVPAVERIMIIIEIVKGKIECMDNLTEVVQTCDVNEAYDAIEMLREMHKILLPSQFTPLIGPLSCKFVEVLRLFYEVIPEMKKPSDRHQCKWNIFKLSLIGRQNETFREMEVQILNEWINLYKEEYFSAKLVGRY